jgi:hypothetical protein
MPLIGGCLSLVTASGPRAHRARLHIFDRERWPVHATAACAGDELPAFCRAPRSIFSRPPSKLSVAPRLPCSSTTHTIHLVRRLSSATCFDRRHGIAWCPFQLPLHWRRRVACSFSPSSPLFGASCRVSTPRLADRPRKSPRPRSRPEQPPPIATWTRRTTRQTSGWMHMAAICFTSSTS